MDLRLQAKLLRAVQERVIDRVGGSQPVKVDIRIIATSNRNLEEAVAKGTFREDLLFRLNVVTLLLPPLRSRPADLEILADHFVRKYAESNGIPQRRLSAAARQKLLAHTWRGNVRELENALHRAVLLAKGEEIEAEAITLSIPAPQPGSGVAAQAARATLPTETAARALVGSTVAEVERDLIIGTLYHCLGNRTHAANILGISIRTLRNKLKLYTSEGVNIPHPGEIDRAAL
jgi:DNA-binding NtrC family response regulator